MRAERTAAAAEQVDAGRAVAGRAGPLLPVHFFAGAMDVGAVLHFVGATLALGQLPDHAAMDDVGARLKPENLIGHGDRTGFLAVEAGDFQFHHAPPASWPTETGAVAALSASLNLPGFGASFGSDFFTAS